MPECKMGHALWSLPPLVRSAKNAGFCLGCILKIITKESGKDVYDVTYDKQEQESKARSEQWLVTGRLRK